MFWTLAQLEMLNISLRSKHKLVCHIITSYLSRFANNCELVTDSSTHKTRQTCSADHVIHVLSLSEFIAKLKLLNHNHNIQIQIVIVVFAYLILLNIRNNMQLTLILTCNSKNIQQCEYLLLSFNNIIATNPKIQQVWQYAVDFNWVTTSLRSMSYCTYGFPYNLETSCEFDCGVGNCQYNLLYGDYCCTVDLTGITDFIDAGLTMMSKIIVGVCVGGGLLLLLSIVGCYFCCRPKRQTHSTVVVSGGQPQMMQPAVPMMPQQQYGQPMMNQPNQVAMPIQ
ncbi:Hypothetical_protein [Hexamita inflata]|uniref:Hypothetical_protein n=1 Tax=Hexamita inflata TaxID=28002 RepID=A0AA86VSF2_9EUKA|nr:Hypothetical protein HINF_LOCUS63513 [Hexamita inflata]